MAATTDDDEKGLSAWRKEIATGRQRHGLSMGQAVLAAARNGTYSDPCSAENAETPTP